jgi:3-oxoacyl-[acyl-carrier protein] reductase
VNELFDRHCLVTGASRGLGEQIARRFWDAGASLFLVARSTDRLAAIAASLPPRRGQGMTTFTADLSRPEAAVSTLQACRRVFPRLDVLVNNAGIQGPIGPVHEHASGAWEETFETNFFAPVRLCRLGVLWMIEQRAGKIINLSGGGATSARPRFAAYASAKTALVRFSETLAEELREHRIDVNCIAPGVMPTEMLREVVDAGPATAGPREYDIARQAEGTAATAFERATGLCMFLASRASDGITGKLISAVWDPWETLSSKLQELQSDVYTLRRILPKDRGHKWGDR